jgi:hypothetical protein
MEMNNFLGINNDREFIRALTEIRGSILEKIENTPIDRDMPDLMIRFLERLIKLKDSEICSHLLHLFVESSFFTKFSLYINKMMVADPSKDLDKKYKFKMAAIRTMN